MTLRLFAGSIAAALAVATIAVSIAPAMAHPHHNSRVVTCHSQGTAGHRTILVRFPGRRDCLISVRPGQDDRAAAFQNIYGGNPITTADANHLQNHYRITAVWVEGWGGPDEVHFQRWNWN